MNDDRNIREKLEEIYQTYKFQMLGTAYHLLKDRQLAQDAVQETMRKLVMQYARLPKGSSDKLKAYIFRVLKNTAIDFLRERKNMVFTSDLAFVEGRDDPHSMVISDEGVREIYHAIQKLPANYASVMYLKYIKSFTNDEISDALQITTTAVDMRLSRGRKKLKKYLEEGRS